MNTIALLTLVTASLAVGGGTQHSELSRITNRYGGPGNLAQASYLYMHGRKCWAGKAAELLRYMPPCQEFKFYQMGPSTYREEEVFNYKNVFINTTVKIIQQDRRVMYLQEPWWDRALLWTEGFKDGPLSAVEVTSFHFRGEIPVPHFLLGADARDVTFQENTKTLDGRASEAFSVTIGKRVIEYFFDPETLLCLQITVTTSGTHATSHYTELYTDYRDVNGLPYPFHIQKFTGKSLTEEDTLDSVQLGIPLNNKLLKVPIMQPLWVLPAMVLLVLVGGTGIVFVWRRRRKHSHQ